MKRIFTILLILLSISVFSQTTVIGHVFAEVVPNVTVDTTISFIAPTQIKNATMFNYSCSIIVSDTLVINKTKIIAKPTKSLTIIYN